MWSRTLAPSAVARRASSAASSSEMINLMNSTLNLESGRNECRDEEDRESSNETRAVALPDHSSIVTQLSERLVETRETFDTRFARNSNRYVGGRSAESDNLDALLSSLSTAAPPPAVQRQRSETKAASARAPDCTVAPVPPRASCEDAPPAAVVEMIRHLRLSLATLRRWNVKSVTLGTQLPEKRASATRSANCRRILKSRLASTARS